MRKKLHRKKTTARNPRRSKGVSFKFLLIAGIAVVTGLYIAYSLLYGELATSFGASGDYSVTYMAQGYPEILNKDGTNRYVKPEKEAFVGTGSNVNQSWTGLRFTGAVLPADAIITAAKLDLTLARDANVTVSYELAGEKIASSKSFADYTNISERTRVERISDSKTVTAAKGSVYSFDVTRQVKGVSAVSGWQKSGPITIIFRGRNNANQRFWFVADPNTSDVPKLTVYYKTDSSVPPTATPVIPTNPPTAAPLPTSAPTTVISSPTPTRVPTAAPANEPIPTSTPVPPPPATGASRGIWFSREEIRSMPKGGEAGCTGRCADAWNALLTGANRTVDKSRLDIDDQESQEGVHALAKALVWVKTGNEMYRQQAYDIIRGVVGTEQPGVGPYTSDSRSLAIGRMLPAYVYAADIIDLTSYDPSYDQNTFRPWLDYLLTRKNSESRSLETCHRERPNNWGGHCGAARLSASLYLLDHETDATRRNKAQLHYTDAVKVLRGWLGDRSAYASFTFEAAAFTWMPDKTQPRAINPKGAVVSGHNVDGVAPDDQRRAAPYNFSWPPNQTNYSWGAQEGPVLMAHMLAHRGSDVFTWSDRALARASEWMFYGGDGKAIWDTCEALNKTYIVDIEDYWMGTDFVSRMRCAQGKAAPTGRNVGWTSWTHVRR